MAQPITRAQSRRRRLRRRIAAICGYVVIAILLAWFLELRLPTTVIFVRHADTDSPNVAAGDPPLNARGRLRAELLADFLAHLVAVDDDRLAVVALYRSRCAVG